MMYYGCILNHCMECILMNFAGVIASTDKKRHLVEFQIWFQGKRYIQCAKVCRKKWWCFNRDVSDDKQLLQKLEGKANQNRTAELWLDNLIKVAVFFMMLSIGAERKTDQPLKSAHGLQQMVLYVMYSDWFSVNLCASYVCTYLVQCAICDTHTFKQQTI